jgi:hypothetical protein
MNERNQGITYSKEAPKYISYYKYFDQVKLRLGNTGHIASFTHFLNAFI